MKSKCKGPADTQRGGGGVGAGEEGEKVPVRLSGECGMDPLLTWPFLSLERSLPALTVGSRGLA